MPAVRSQARFNVTRKSSRGKMTRRPVRNSEKEVINDVTELSNKDAVDVGFCGESFAVRFLSEVGAR